MTNRAMKGCLRGGIVPFIKLESKRLLCYKLRGLAGSGLPECATVNKLGKFEIKQQLGQGGMGVVYRAWDSRMERWVALKTISPEKADREEFLKRFRKEALSAGRLDHPNIVTVYEFDEQDDVCYIAMQFLEGSDLEGLLSSPRWDKEFNIFRKLDILIQVCQGLAYAHRNGVVHRDVKPGNIMVLPDGSVKIVDFGIARIGEATSGTQSLLMGTAPYMAPEQVEGRLTDERVDVFAVGVIAYRMFTGHFPFEGPNLSSILFKIVHEPPPPLGTYVSEYPPELERIILVALAKDREQRYRTMEEMGFELQGLLSSLNTSLISSYLEEARRLVLLRDFGKAKDLLRKVLELEPGNSAATAQWRQVQELLQQEYTKRKAQQLLNEGIEAYERGDWVRALECFEQGLHLEPGHETLLTYRNLTLREQEKIAAVSQNLKAAREYLQRRDLAGARQCLVMVLDLNPENADAQRLLKQVEEELAEIAKRRDARQYLDRAQQALLNKQYGDALSLLDKAQALDPKDPETNRLRALVLGEQAEAEQHKVRAEKIAAGQAALEKSDFATAVQQAEVGLRAFPKDPALQQLLIRANQGLEQVRRRKQLAEQFELAQTLLERGDLAGARKILTSIRERDPHDPRVQTLAQAIAKLEERLERERLRDAELERARALMRDNRHGEARQVLLDARDRFGRSAPLQELLNFLNQEVKRLQQEREAHEVLQQAAQFLEAGAHPKALQLLQKAARKYKHPAIGEELNRAQKLAREAEERRAFFERVEALVQKKAWTPALNLMGEAPESYRRLPRYGELWQAAASGAGGGPATPQDEIPTATIAAGVERARVPRKVLQPRLATPLPAVRKAAGWGTTAWETVTAAAGEVAERVRDRVAEFPDVVRRKPALKYVLLVALLALVVRTVEIARLASRRAAVPESPAAGPPAIVRLEVAPWAEIKEVKNMATGAVLRISGQTPMEFSVPPGEYRLVLSHPKFGDLSLPVRGRAGQVTDIRRSFPGFDPAEVLKAYE